MKELRFTEDNVRLNVEVSDWEDAIRMSIGILEENGFVNEDYVGEVISAVKQYGPYILIHPGLAIPHTRAENGALKIGFSLLTLKEPVLFKGNEDPVHVLIGFSATDSEKHLEIIKMIVNFVENGLVEKISDVSSVKELNELYNLTF